MFLFRRTKITISREPDIRPMVNFLHGRFLTTGISSFAAAQLAIALVSEDIEHMVILAGLDAEIIERIAVMHEVTNEAMLLNEITKRRMSILFWLNATLAVLVSLFFVLLIERLLLH